jgi:hypothetical protein
MTVTKTITKTKKPNLSNLYENILNGDNQINKQRDNQRDNQINKQKDILELKELTITPKKEQYNDMPHYHVLTANFLEQADLLFLPTASFGYKYLLVVVDANTLKVDAEPLKSKNSIEILKGLQKIYKRGILIKPTYLSIDSGSEFAEIKKWAEENDIIIKVGHVNRHRQQALVEAKNKIIGSNLNKILAANELKTNKLSKNWLPFLRPLIDLINENLRKPKSNLPSDEPIITKNNDEILPIGSRVRVLLDVIKDINGKTLLGVRSGDLRWSRDIHTVENFVLTPSQPPMYYISGEKAIARTRQQLLVVNNIFV